MKLYTDRDMISVLKDVGLWEILCGISLAQAHAGDDTSAHIRRGSQRSQTSGLSIITHVQHRPLLESFLRT